MFGAPSWKNLTPSTKVLLILVEGHLFYGLVWLLLLGHARLRGHRTLKICVNFGVAAPRPWGLNRKINPPIIFSGHTTNNWCK